MYTYQDLEYQAKACLSGVSTSRYSNKNSQVLLLLFFFNVAH